MLQAVRWLSIAGMLVAASVEAGEARVAVASNFTATMQVLIEDFEQRSDHRLRVSYGSTGKLYTQIYNGAPFDLFLAADAERPARAEREGLAVAGTRITYARGRLALWSRDPEPEQRFKRGDYRRLAIANPKVAPYGAAALKVLDNLGLEGAEGRLVMGENIAQTYQFVATGNTDLGLVAVAQLNGRAEGYHWIIPEQLYPPLPQQAVLLQRGADSDAARAFLSYLGGDAARTIIAGFGYGLE